MQPVYVKKANPEDRVTWIDKLIALELNGDLSDVVEMTRRQGRAYSVFAAILAVDSEAGRAAA
jgi:hypothetical protein